MPKPDEIEYATKPEFDALILREIAVLTMEERVGMQAFARSVARELQHAGVDFSKADAAKIGER